MPPWKQVFNTGQGHIQAGVIFKNCFIAISSIFQQADRPAPYVLEDSKAECTE